MAEPMFAGAFCALITPFKDDAVDEEAVFALAERQIHFGAHGLVPATVIGESPALSHAEHRRVIALTVEAAADAVPVIAGAGSNCTAEALDLVAFAKQAGAQAALVTTPYYNRPSQAGMLAHFTALSQAAELPLLIHNATARTGVDLSVETIVALARLPNVVGLVDDAGDLGRLGLLRVLCPEGFALFTGDDASALGHMAQGGHGCLSLTCNVAPKAVSDFMTDCRDGDWDRALQAQDRMIGLHRLLAADAPAAAKFGLSRMGGLCSAQTRSPVAPAPESSWKAIMDAMSAAAPVMYHAH